MFLKFFNIVNEDCNQICYMTIFEKHILDNVNSNAVCEKMLVILWSKPMNHRPWMISSLFVKKLQEMKVYQENLKYCPEALSPVLVAWRC